MWPNSGVWNHKKFDSKIFSTVPNSFFYINFQKTDLQIHYLNSCFLIRQSISASAEVFQWHLVLQYSAATPSKWYWDKLMSRGDSVLGQKRQKHTDGLNDLSSLWARYTNLLGFFNGLFLAEILTFGTPNSVTKLSKYLLLTWFFLDSKGD